MARPSRTGRASADLIVGSEDADTLLGRAGADTLRGLGGADWLHGGTGDDTLVGGEGGDLLAGWLGRDRVQGGGGDDIVDGGGDDDLARGGSGDDSIAGERGDDTIGGGDGDDTLSGGAGHDLLRGAGGADLLDGGSGGDLLLGGAGRDTLLGGAGSDTLRGGSGRDEFAFGRTDGLDVVRGFSFDDDIIRLTGGGSYRVAYDAVRNVSVLTHGGTSISFHGFDLSDGATIVLDGENHAPEYDPIVLGRYSEDAPPIVIDLRPGQSDPDGDPLTFTIIRVADSVRGEAVYVDNLDGTIVIDPSQYDDLEYGLNRIVSVQYVITDGRLEISATATLVIEGADEDGPPGAPAGPVAFIHGVHTGGFILTSLSHAGDVDGDGRGDILIGNYAPGITGRGQGGEAYLVYGAAIADVMATGGAIDVNALAGKGVLVKGIGYDGLGISSSSVGDLDGDGLGEVIVGAFLAKPGGATSAGRAYLLFGSTLAAATAAGTLDLARLAVGEGVAIDGDRAYDYAGESVAGVGDVDGDGIADILVAAPLAHPDHRPDAGESTLVFGSTLLAARQAGEVLDLSSLKPDEGVLVIGAAARDRSASHLTSAGDIDGDGLADIVITASSAAGAVPPEGGETTVVFGAAIAAAKAGSGVIDLAEISAATGIVINTNSPKGTGGQDIAGGGDVDGDGVGDLVIGVPGAQVGGAQYAGITYVLFGSALAEAGGTVSVDALAPAEGVAIRGAGAFHTSGGAVAIAGDVDGDGLDDVLIGADGVEGQSQTGLTLGASYLIFGSALVAAKAGDGVIDLAALSPGEGILIEGRDRAGAFGTEVSAAGDVDGDGLADLAASDFFGTDSEDFSFDAEVFVIAGSELLAEKADDGMIDLDAFFV